MSFTYYWMKVVHLLILYPIRISNPYLTLIVELYNDRFLLILISLFFLKKGNNRGKLNHLT